VLVGWFQSAHNRTAVPRQRPAAFGDPARGVVYRRVRSPGGTDRIAEALRDNVYTARGHCRAPRSTSTTPHHPVGELQVAHTGTAQDDVVRRAHGPVRLGLAAYPRRSSHPGLGLVEVDDVAAVPQLERIGERGRNAGCRAAVGQQPGVGRGDLGWGVDAMVPAATRGMTSSRMRRVWPTVVATATSCHRSPGSGRFGQRRGDIDAMMTSDVARRSDSRFTPLAGHRRREHPEQAFVSGGNGDVP
jgi:hypothetical protein